MPLTAAVEGKLLEEAALAAVQLGAEMSGSFGAVLIPAHQHCWEGTTGHCWHPPARQL